MPLILGQNQTDKYFIIGLDDAGAPGIQLLAGQQCNVVSSDPLTVVITPDATPLPTDAAYTLLDGVAVPAGTATLASGTVSIAKPPAQVGVAINVTATLTNADGSPVLDDTGTA